MPSKTEKQKRFFGAVMGAKKGQKKVSGEAKKVAKEMPKKKIEEFLKTEGEEDEQSKKKITLKGPKVKERKHFAPPTKPHNNDKKYKRDKKVDLQESASVIKFIEAIMTKNHAEAHSHLKNMINQKIQQKISQEIEKPLF